MALPRWRDLGMDLTVAVNLSVHSLLDHRLVSDIRQLLDDAQLPAGALVIELTESSVLTESRRALTILGALDELGVELSVDDFGTGYSSLVRLRGLPISEIKIDRSFIADLDRVPEDGAIVGATIQLGHRLGLKVVAEGIETYNSLERVRHLHCDVAQGFLISPPRTARDLESWLLAAPGFPVRRQKPPGAVPRRRASRADRRRRMPFGGDGPRFEGMEPVRAIRRGAEAGQVTFTGRLLVATPVIADPNFERTVVLILAHGDEGALGVVLNRPSLTAVAEVVEEWAPYAAEPEMMFIGGPVGQNAVVGLGPRSASHDGIQPVVGPLGTIDLNEPPDPDDGAAVTVRLFAGSAGWALGPARGRAGRGGVVAHRRRPRRPAHQPTRRAVVPGPPPPGHQGLLVRQPPGRPDERLAGRLESPRTLGAEPARPLLVGGGGVTLGPWPRCRSRGRRRRSW